MTIFVGRSSRSSYCHGSLVTHDSQCMYRWVSVTSGYWASPTDFKIFKGAKYEKNDVNETYPHLVPMWWTCWAAAAAAALSWVPHTACRLWPASSLLLNQTLNLFSTSHLHIARNGEENKTQTSTHRMEYTGLGCPANTPSPTVSWLPCSFDIPREVSTVCPRLVSKMCCRYSRISASKCQPSDWGKTS